MRAVEMSPAPRLCPGADDGFLCLRAGLAQMTESCAGEASPLRLRPEMTPGSRCRVSLPSLRARAPPMASNARIVSWRNGGLCACGQLDSLTHTVRVRLLTWII